MADRDDETSLFTSRLPPEIRNEIYQYLLLAKNARIYADDVGRVTAPFTSRSSWEPLCAKLWPPSRFSFHTAILGTNRKIYDEAIRVLYHENLFIHLSTSDSSVAYLIEMSGIPTLYEGERGSKAQFFEHCAMSVIFENCPEPLIDENERFHYVVAYDDLGSFCEALLYDANDSILNLSETTFEINIHHQFNEDLSIEPRSNSVQRRLLQPFMGLHSVLNFKITGQVNMKYADSVIAKVTSPAPNVEETVDRVMSMTRGARSFSKRGYYAQAIDKYKSAVVQTFTKYLNPENIVQKGPLVGRTESFAFSYLDFMLACKIAMCHAKLEEWEEAHYWACDATCTRLFTTEHAEIIYLTAWVMDDVSNKALQVVETLVEKLSKTPEGDIYVDWDLSSLKEKMRSKEGMDSLRDLKAAMKGLADRDLAGEFNHEWAK